MIRASLPGVCLVLALALFSVPVLSQIYKWVDDKGVTHYSSTPPANTPSRRLQDIPTPSPDERENARERSQDLIDEARRADVERRRLQAQEEEAAASRTREADADATACGHARQQLAVLEAGGPAFRRDESGARVYLEDRQRDAEIARLRAEVERACASVDPQRASTETEREHWRHRRDELCLRRIEQLRELERPELRASKADIERARVAVDQACGPGAQ